MPTPHKADAQRLLEQRVSRSERLVTDAEVLREILHRYVAIHRRDAIQPVFDALLGIVDEVFPVSLAATHRAKEIILGDNQLGTRRYPPGDYGAARNSHLAELRYRL